MMECPQCGYVDEPYWRPTFNRKNHEDYTRFENFKIMFPNHWQMCEIEKRVEIEAYVYRLTKFGNVIRTWKPLEQGSRDYDKYRKPLPVNQTKLMI